MPFVPNQNSCSKLCQDPHHRHTVGNALDEVQAIDFIKTQHLSTHVFLIFCDNIKHSCCIPKQKSHVGEKKKPHLGICHVRRKDGQTCCPCMSTDRHVHSDAGVRHALSPKWLEQSWFTDRKTTNNVSPMILSELPTSKM